MNTMKLGAWFVLGVAATCSDHDRMGFLILAAALWIVSE